MERVNTTAKIANWDSELNWFGFMNADGMTEDECQERERAVRTLLRRFVSKEWIEKRLED